MIELFQAIRIVGATLAFFLVVAAAPSPASPLTSDELAIRAFPAARGAVWHAALAPAASVVHPAVHPGAAAERRALLERIGGTEDARELLVIERRLCDLDTHSRR
ncbi:MAG: hypothetical protein ACKVSF_15160 [Alphaproteobacteria bacterium]